MCLCTRSKTKICSKNECRDNSDVNIMYMVIIIHILQTNCPLVPFTHILDHKVIVNTAVEHGLR